MYWQMNTPEVSHRALHADRASLCKGDEYDFVRKKLNY